MNPETLILPTIRGIEFIGNSILFIHLENDRTFIVPLNKFPGIKKLSSEQRNDFEIIDEHHLSFTSLDEVYSINELIGL